MNGGNPRKLFTYPGENMSTVVLGRERQGKSHLVVHMAGGHELRGGQVRARRHAIGLDGLQRLRGPTLNESTHESAGRRTTHRAAKPTVARTQRSPVQLGRFSKRDHTGKTRSGVPDHARRATPEKSQRCIRIHPFMCSVESRCASRAMRIARARADRSRHLGGISNVPNNQRGND